MSATVPKTDLSGIRYAAGDLIEAAFKRGVKHGRYLEQQQYQTITKATTQDFIALKKDFDAYRERNIKKESGVFACDMCKYGGDPYRDEAAGVNCPAGCDGVSHWVWRGVQE